MAVRLTITKITYALALTMLIAAGVTWKVRYARALNPQPDPPGKFGMVGITRGQTLRLNVVNLQPPTDPDRRLPPDPCRVVLSFRNAEGQPVRNNDGQIIRSTVELQSGESAFLDFNGNQIGGIDTNAPGRMQLRPFVRVNLEPDPGPQVPPDPCRATAEVFDNVTLQTTFVLTGSERMGSPEGHNHNETMVQDR